MLRPVLVGLCHPLLDLARGCQLGDSGELGRGGFDVLGVAAAHVWCVAVHRLLSTVVADVQRHAIPAVGRDATTKLLGALPDHSREVANRLAVCGLLTSTRPVAIVHLVVPALDGLCDCGVTSRKVLACLNFVVARGVLKLFPVGPLLGVLCD